MKLDYDLIESICHFRYNNNNGTLCNPIRVNLRDAQPDQHGNIVASFLVESTGTSPHLTDMFITKDEYLSKLREKKLKSIGI
jgi:hypothetical protein